VQALLRRSGRRDTRIAETYGDAYLTIDVAQREVRVGDRPVQLTPLEFKLLSAFVQHLRMVLSREQLLELVWHDAGPASPDQVKLYVGYLRRKLDPEHPERVPIETMRGFGYRYVPPAKA
jgi:DNA-binding response OmpR family regulator